MLFNSLAFAIFLPIVFLLYWLVPHRFRWCFILLANYYFYMSGAPQYVVLILGITVISYLSALFIEKVEKTSIKKVILCVTVTSYLGVLGVFKYFNFFSVSAEKICSIFEIELHPVTLNLILPIGISFYTFQALGYVVDVYKEKVGAEKNLGYYAAFISFFPVVLSGPIERSSNLLPQIKKEHSFEYEKTVYGMRLMAWGYFKKMVIADNIAICVDRIYGNVYDYKGLVLIAATILFTIQIYCDFSGYSDIAIGVAKLFGIDLIINFKSPYLAVSIKEFWSRWHISLSTWFRDYVYIPLGGNRVTKVRHGLNLVITFLISGLWHGANWTYVIWGAIHGIAQVVESTIFKKEIQKKRNIIKVLFTFIFVAFAWIFFRADSITDAVYVISNGMYGISNPLLYIKQGYYDLGLEKLDILVIGFGSLVLMVYDYISMKRDVIKLIGELKVGIRWAIYLVVIWSIVLFMPIINTGEFIYFQF